LIDDIRNEDVAAVITVPVAQKKTRFLIDVLSGWQRLQLVLLLSIWTATEVFFWQYWLQTEHVVTWTGFVFNTLLILWFTALPAYFLFFLTRMKKPDPKLTIPNGLRVAMVVTRAPSEPFSVVRRTLEAMLGQSYPHDTWLADEQPTDEIASWCLENGVQISSRYGVSEYHQPRWPRRTRTKEGNLAYFYDNYGYDRYDFVSQLDCDHVPSPGYLEAMLRPFLDSQIGYVSAPSICDANADASWAARARLYAEGSLHGALQAGYNGGWAPLCIGSHYAVRTTALREIGGLGPELAEDHSTTLMMNSKGWRGVHALDAEAHGDGPITFADCMTQEFQWSRSLITLLFTLYPRRFLGLPFHLKIQFFFSEVWYLLFGVAMFGGYAAPVIALLLKEPLVDVSYVAFWIHGTPLTLCLIWIIWWVKRNNLLRPQQTRVMSWEVALFQLARWPWLLAGCICGIAAASSSNPLSFRVTPKTKSETLRLPLILFAPYLAIVFVAAIALILVGNAGSAQGYYWLTLVNGVAYLVVATAIYWLYFAERHHA
jgi:cellulose synthase (UDP-forming)